MSSEWSQKTLGQFVRLQRGHDLPASAQRPGKYPVMGSAGPNGCHDIAKAKGPGVVVGRSGASMGRVHYSDTDYWPHNTCLFVTDFQGNNPKFAYYLLSSLDLAGYNSGSAQPSLNRNYIYDMQLSIPPRGEQDAIVKVLSTLDDRITLLRETNKTLESIAQAIFKSWFVDFDPVRAKVEGRQHEGMDEATAALFPDSFEESELGLVPKGWKVGTLSELTNLHKGSINPGATPELIFQHFSLPAFDDGQMPVLEPGSEIKSNKTSVPSDAVLLSKLNPHIPRIWLPSDVKKNAVCSTEFLPFGPKGAASTAFLYSLLSQQTFISSLNQLVTGTSNSHQRIRPNSVLSLPTIIPSADTLDKFTSVAEALLKKFRANRLQAYCLSELRDTILPRLISGQLRLPEAPERIENALT